jgi:hypothetical protein
MGVQKGLKSVKSLCLAWCISDFHENIMQLCVRKIASITFQLTELSELTKINWWAEGLRRLLIVFLDDPIGQISQ